MTEHTMTDPLQDEPLVVRMIARIAVYDDFLSAPRIIDISPAPVAQFIEHIASKTYELAQQAGGTIPYTVIREITENFIHADFKECTVSILERGKVIRFSDQGPGIERKDLAQKPGFTSATNEMRNYIRGVGSGLPIVREYLSFSHGNLSIEDNINTGTVITISSSPEVPEPTPTPMMRPEPPAQRFGQHMTVMPDTGHDFDIATLGERKKKTLLFIYEEGLAGPTEVSDHLGISVATAHRDLASLDSAGLVTYHGNSKKRILTDQGLELVQNL